MASVTTSASSPVPTSVLVGRVLSSLFVAFLLGASVAPKLLGMPVAEETLIGLGWPSRYVVLIGLLEMAFVILYLLPRTAVLGAVLMTALLGGAIATHLRVRSPLLSHTLFSLYLAAFMWGGLWLRSPALRAVLPILGKV